MARWGKALHALVGGEAIWMPKMSQSSREKSAESWDSAMQALRIAGAVEDWLRSSAGKDFLMKQAWNSEDGGTSHTEQY